MMPRRSPPAGLDRIVAGAAATVRRALPAKRIAESAIAAVAAEPARLQSLRYGLRRDGFSAPLVAECLALFSGLLGEPLRAGVAAAVRSLLSGALVELADAAGRRQALAAAAGAHALRGDPVHVLCATEASARDSAAFLEPLLARLGLRVSSVSRELGMAARREAYAAAVVCGAQREIGLDHLRERLQNPQARGELRARLQPLADPGARALLPALGCALVDEADLALIDDAYAPLMLAAPAEAAGERLLYEQALELARALAAGKDYTIEEDGARLAEPAAQLLERLVAPLGGPWSSRQRREQLITLALEALHCLERDADYRVEGGRVAWPQKEGEPEAPSAEEIDLRHLVEVKEGCRLGNKTETLARLSLPRFYGRYAALAGICADARGLESELWALYSLATVRSGRRAAAPVVHARVFVDAERKRAALAERATQGSCLVGVRLRTELDALNALAAASGTAIEAVVLPLVEARPPKPGAELVAAELPASRRHLAHAGRVLGTARCTVYLSLDEPGVAASLGSLLAWRARRAAREDGELEKRWADRVVRRALRYAEAAQRLARLDVLANDRMVEDLLAVSGKAE